MRKRKTTKKTQKRKRQPSRAVRERALIPWKYGVLTVICVALLIVGFFGAARQHFASIDYGIKNSKLRNQIKELESEKQRLILAREVAYSPEKIKKAARKIGMVETSNNFQPNYSAVKISSDETENDKSETTELKDDSARKKNEKAKVENLEPKSKHKKNTEKTAVNLKKKSVDKKSKTKDSKKSKPKVRKAKDSTTTRSRKVKAEK